MFLKSWQQPWPQWSNIPDPNYSLFHDPLRYKGSVFWLYKLLHVHGRGQSRLGKAHLHLSVTQDSKRLRIKEVNSSSQLIFPAIPHSPPSFSSRVLLACVCCGNRLVADSLTGQKLGHFILLALKGQFTLAFQKDLLKCINIRKYILKLVCQIRKFIQAFY